MGISSRQVKNKRNQDGVSTDRSGTVYDVYIRYKTADGYKTYGKRGFVTKQEAIKHEAEMRTKLLNPGFEVTKAADAKQTVKEYLDAWIDLHGKINLRPSTLAGYKTNIKNHVLPYIGNVPLNKVTPAILDNLFAKLFDKGLSHNSVKYVQRTLSVAFEAARKYHYIEYNPAKDTITKFNQQGDIPAPYTVEQMKQLMSLSKDSEMEIIMVLSGMYGLRRNEVLGLRWDNVDLKNRTFSIVEQLPFYIAPGTTNIEDMAPTKSHDRILPITEVTYQFFIKQKDIQEKHQKRSRVSGYEYYSNNLVVANANGSPYRGDNLSKKFKLFLQQNNMPHIRFHDLRHTAATNMHQLTGDFFTVGEILGHTLKGIGISLGISGNLDAVTTQYIDVRLDRKLTVLEAYHNALLPKEISNIKIKNRDER